MDTKRKILFTGDSITDTFRTNLAQGMMEMMHRMGQGGSPEEMTARTNDILGTGYALMAAARLSYEHPGKYEFLNRGISGHRVVDLDARVKQDCINLSPDIVSIMIGINDVWHEAMMKNGVDAVKFERVYDAMLAEIKAALPQVQFVLIEPFVLKGPATEAQWDYFRDETELRRQTTVRLAQKYGAKLLPAQKLFDDALAASGCVADWTADGVHPSPAGHWMLSQAWVDLCADIL